MFFEHAPAGGQVILRKERQSRCDRVAPEPITDGKSNTCSEKSVGQTSFMTEATSDPPLGASQNTRAVSLMAQSVPCLARAVDSNPTKAPLS